MYKTLREYRMTGPHKAAIASAHRGTHHDAETRSKISSSMSGRANHAGKKHSTDSKDRIRHERGHDDRIDGAKWIVNRSDKTYRRHNAPDGYKIGQRRFNEMRVYLDSQR
jgi:hypothetical protein